MPNDELTFVEKSVLLILMAEAIELPNVELTNKHRVKVAVTSRAKLEQLGLVKTRTENRRLYWDLTDEGWKKGIEELGVPAPEGAGSGGAALYAMLAKIRSYLDQADVPYQDFFQPANHDASSGPTGPTGPEIEARIRAAYAKLARRPGEWVKLADLRDELGSLPRHAVDAILVALNRTPSVNLVPESNQKMLTKRERDAAVIIGNHDNHAISIGS